MKQVLLLLLFVFIKNVSAQDYLIGFTGSGVVTNVEKIKVENLSQSVSIDLSGNDMLHLVGTVSSNEMNSLTNKCSLKIYPVPSNEVTGVEYNTTESGITKFEIFDISGRRICFLNIFLEKGLHLFSVSKMNKGIYFLKATGKENILVSKFRCFGNFIGNFQIIHISSSPDMTNLKSNLSEVVMQYNEGDFLRLTGISGKYSITVTDIPKESETIDFQFFECEDADGFNYPTVKIGTQIWMKENLKTSRYRNRDIIGTSDPLNLDLTNVEDPKFQWSYNGEACHSLINQLKQIGLNFQPLFFQHL